MCGIVGVIGATALTFGNTNIFKHMLQMDVVRGKDSVGLISETGGKITCAKSITNPTDFLEHRRVAPILSGAVRALVGHNRHATKGSVSVNNAHPFEHGPISLVHNGTLTYPMPAHAHLFDTDSESIAYNLSLIPPEEAGAFIGTLSGAFTLVWYDSRDSSWNLIRNNERPLTLMQNVSNTVLYLSSEAGILYAATTKEKMEVVPATHIFELPVGQLWKYTVQAGVLQREVRTVELKKPTVHTSTHTSTRSTYTPPVQNNTGRRNNTHGDSIEDFKRELNMLPGWYPCTVMEFKPSRHDPKRGELHLMLDQHPYNDIQMFGVAEPDSDEVEVYLGTLWYGIAGNRTAIQPNEFTLTSTQLRPRTKKQLPVVLNNDDGEIVDSTEQQYKRDVPELDTVLCEACEEHQPVLECAQLMDATFVCGACYGSTVAIQSHCAHVGFLYNFGEIPE